MIKKLVNFIKNIFSGNKQKFLKTPEKIDIKKNKKIFDDSIRIENFVPNSDFEAIAKKICENDITINSLSNNQLVNLVKYFGKKDRYLNAQIVNVKKDIEILNSDIKIKTDNI